MSYEAHESSEDYAAPPRHARRLCITTRNPLNGEMVTTEYLEHALEPLLMKHQAYWRGFFADDSNDIQPSTVRVVLFKDRRIMWARGPGAFEQNVWDELANERNYTAHLEAQKVGTTDGRHALCAHVVTDVYRLPESRELLIPQSTYDLIALVGATTNAADNVFLIVEGMQPEHHDNPKPKQLFAGDLEAYFTSRDRPRPLSGS